MVNSLTPSLEDYLETILMISLQEKVVRVKDVVKLLNVKAASVIGAIKILSEKRLVNHEKYGYIELTSKGERAAKKIYEKHQILFKLFHKVLGVNIQTAMKDACQIEHYISEETTKKITELVEYIETLSDKKKDLWLSDFGNFIRESALKKKNTQNNKDGRNKVSSILTLNNLKIGQKAKIIKIDPGSKIKKQLLSMGVLPGVEVTVRKVAPLGDPIDIVLKGYHLSLRKEEAVGIEVEVLE
ncbi:DtxR family transcriptional regulator [bacterium]|nr:DtxR family transcriptional regulator [bacterium]